MQVDPSSKVSDIALGHPGAVRVFRKYHIDFCCGGQVPLMTACEGVGAPLEHVIQEIAREDDRAPGHRPDDGKDWKQASTPELLSHIVDTHHTYTRDAIALIQPLMDKVCRVHGPRHPELQEVAQLFSELRAELEPHLRKEERILFPALTAMANGHEVHTPFGPISNPIRVMLLEHDNAGSLLRALRGETGNYTPPVDSCGSYRALYCELESLENDLHMHIHLENNVLFPRFLVS